MLALRCLRTASVIAVVAGAALGACGSDGAERSATSAPSTTTTTSEPPAAVARIIAAGDSMMYDVAPALAAALDPATSEVETMVLPSLHAASARTTLYQAMRADPTDVVVVMVGVWESGYVTSGGLEITEPGWGTGYRAEVLDPLVDEVSEDGVHLVLVEEPPMRSADAQALFDIIAVEWRQVAEDHPDTVTFAPSAKWLGGGDAFLEVAALPDGTEARLRRTDGIHFCAEGAIRVALGLIDVIDEVVDPSWEPVLAEGWEQGSWTDRFPLDECPPVGTTP